MAVTVDVYKGCIKLGSGSCTNNSASLTSYTGTAPSSGRNVQVHGRVSVSCGTGGVFNTRVVTDGGTTLTLYDVCPFT